MKEPTTINRKRLIQAIALAAGAQQLVDLVFAELDAFTDLYLRARQAERATDTAGAAA